LTICKNVGELIDALSKLDPSTKVGSTEVEPSGFTHYYDTLSVDRSFLSKRGDSLLEGDAPGGATEVVTFS
jgi:hypothetical protein